MCKPYLLTLVGRQANIRMGILVSCPNLGWDEKLTDNLEHTNINEIRILWIPGDIGINNVSYWNRVNEALAVRS